MYMNTIVQTLWSQSFLQSAFLLLLTAILVRIVKAIIDYMSFKRQKRLEAELAQQGKVIDYKTKLLDDIGKSSWEYWLLVKEPAYCKKRENEKEYEVAIQQYNQRAPILFGE